MQTNNIRIVSDDAMTQTHFHISGCWCGDPQVQLPPENYQLEPSQISLLLAWRTQFYLYAIKSKIHNSVNICPWSLNVSNSRFLKLIMIWTWRHHGMALGRHNGGVEHNALFLTTASNVKPGLKLRTSSPQTRLDCIKQVTQNITPDYMPCNPAKSRGRGVNNCIIKLIKWIPILH